MCAYFCTSEHDGCLANCQHQMVIRHTKLYFPKYEFEKSFSYQAFAAWQLSILLTLCVETWIIMHLTCHSIPKDFPRDVFLGCFHPTLYFELLRMMLWFPCTTGHRCDVSECGEVLIVDEIWRTAMKCALQHYRIRMLNLAVNIFWKVQTGCPNIPGHKSRYCSLHAACSALLHDVQFLKMAAQ